MRYIFVCLVVGGVFGGSGAQVSDYETTLGPLPPSSFSCRHRPPGYYADPDTGCTTYHVCDGHSHFTYVCPPRTLFRQQTRICDHAYLVSCDDSLPRHAGPEAYRPKETPGPEDHLDAHPFLRLRDVPPKGPHLPEDYEDFSSPTENFSAEEPPGQTTFDAPTTLPPTSAPSQPKKYLRFSLKDFRPLFYIPDVDQNSIVASDVRHFFLPLDGDDIKFRSRPGVRKSRDSSCPGHCEPRFLLPGTCRPCVIIK